ncbi:prepilin-type N-terminal cleavage/methylation domain-containing protein [bacterium]|nr:prepilin-type N-terminal cleavage/methylation domain-containing protein [bacterium]
MKKISKLQVSATGSYFEALIKESQGLQKLKVGFTLAEVLITLVIIGVVAAITVPILFNNTSDKEYNVARQKAKATIGEAFRQASVQGELTTSITSAKDFIDEVLAKRYLKIAKSCENATDCGFTAKIKRPDGKEVDIDKNMTESTDAYAITALPDFTSGSANYGTYSKTNPITSSVYITPAYFQTLDGFSVKLFYNPMCAANPKDKPYYYDPNETGSNDVLLRQFSLDVACLYGVYDMNGTKGPNQVGKDIGFVGSFYNGYEAIAAATLPHSGEVKASEAPGTSGNDYPQRAAQYCQNLDSENNWVLPDINEFSLIYLNRYMFTDTNDKWFWSRSVLPGSSLYGCIVRFDIGNRTWYSRSNSGGWVLCVRNTALK